MVLSYSLVPFHHLKSVSVSRSLCVKLIVLLICVFNSLVVHEMHLYHVLSLMSAGYSQQSELLKGHTIL